MRKFYLFVFLVFFVIDANAQFSISGEFRPRFEFRDSYRSLPPAINQTPAYVISQRTRLNLNFKKGIINSCLSIQDVRLWGDEPMKKDIAGLGLYQGWVELKVFDSLFLKTGRQELVFDNERLLSNTNWQQKALTHDALLLKYKFKRFTADLAIAYNSSKDTNNSNDYDTKLGNYKTLGFLWLKYKINKNFIIQAAGISDTYQKKGTTSTLYNRITTGGVFYYQNKFINLETRLFYQFGKEETGLNIKDAYYTSVELTAKPFDFFAPKAGTEIFSGNRLNSIITRVNYFSPLYGSGHKFNGYIDFFTKPGDTKFGGLIDIYLSLPFTLRKKYLLQADFHYFRTYYENKETYNTPNLGYEIDLYSKIQIMKELDVQIGHSSFIGTSTLIEIQGNNRKNFSHFAYLMLTVKPEFFKLDFDKK